MKKVLLLGLAVLLCLAPAFAQAQDAQTYGKWDDRFFYIDALKINVEVLQGAQIVTAEELASLNTESADYATKPIILAVATEPGDVLVRVAREAVEDATDAAAYAQLMIDDMKKQLAEAGCEVSEVVKKPVADNVGVHFMVTSQGIRQEFFVVVADGGAYVISFRYPESATDLVAEGIMLRFVQ